MKTRSDKKNNYNPTYRVWSSMRQRCSCPTHQSWQNYGARGITVCDRWDASYEAFVEDMGLKPEGLSLDRIDVNGPYEPGNCRWADMTTQNRNRTNNVLYGGKTLMEIMEERGEVEAYHRVRLCLFKGQSLEEALECKPRRGKIEWRGEKITVTELSIRHNISNATMLKHLDRGLSPEEAVALILENKSKMTEAQKLCCKKS